MEKSLLRQRLAHSGCRPGGRMRALRGVGPRPARAPRGERSGFGCRRREPSGRHCFPTRC